MYIHILHTYTAAKFTFCLNQSHTYSTFDMIFCTNLLKYVYNVEPFVRPSLREVVLALIQKGRMAFRIINSLSDAYIRQ